MIFPSAVKRRTFAEFRHKFIDDGNPLGMMKTEIITRVAISTDVKLNASIAN